MPRRPSTRPLQGYSVPILLAPLLLAACGGSGARDVLDRLRHASAHERYAASLRAAGLADAALGRDWSAAAERAVRAPLAIALPYRETGFFAPDEAAAVGLRVAPRRGERLTVRVESAASEAPAALFVDLFEVPLDSAALARGEGPRLVASAPAEGDSAVPRTARPTSRTVAVNVDDDRVAYVLRLQPELLRGVRYTVGVEVGPSLAFPIPGRGSRAVESYFGADRDAGRRRHEGVDVFAPRGTPVVAATDGVVSGVGVTPIGGKVVWLFDPRRHQALYYAHLDSQLVRTGATVRAGDTLGLVGNTGNARTTPPHLHFGVYRRGEGAVDPFPYIDTRATPTPRLSADTTVLGAWRRIAARTRAMLTGVPMAGTSTGALPPQTALHVDGVAGSLYRVRLPDGAAGFVEARLTEPASRGATVVAGRLAPRRLTSPKELAVRDRPRAEAAVVDSVSARAPLEVLGRYGGYVLVRTAGKREGWVEGGRRLSQVTPD